MLDKIIFNRKVCTIQKKHSSLPLILMKKSTVNNYISINILSL